MPTLAEKYFQEGYDIGYPLGFEMGRIERILEDRFGSIPDFIKDILEKQNDLNRLQEWRKTALKIISLDEFGKAISDSTPSCP